MPAAAGAPQKCRCPQAGAPQKLRCPQATEKPHRHADLACIRSRTPAEMPGIPQPPTWLSGAMARGRDSTTWRKTRGLTRDTHNKRGRNQRSSHARYKFPSPAPTRTKYTKHSYSLSALTPSPPGLMFLHPGISRVWAMRAISNSRHSCAGARQTTSIKCQTRSCK